MTFTDNVKLGISIAKLDRKAMAKAAKDKKGLWPAVFIMVIGGALSGLLALFTGGNFVILSLLSAAVLAPIVAIVWIGLFWLFAKIFGGKGLYSELYRALGHSQVLQWIAFIPIINVLAGIWSLIVTTVIISEVQKMTMARAFLSWFVPIAIITLLLVTVLSALLATLGLVLGANALSSLLANVSVA